MLRNLQLRHTGGQPALFADRYSQDVLRQISEDGRRTIDWETHHPPSVDYRLLLLTSVATPMIAQIEFNAVAEYASWAKV